MNLYTYLAIVCLVFSLSAAAQDCNVANASKIDCGHVGTTQPQCEASGCCWKPEGQNSKIPWCFHPATAPSTSPPIPTGAPFNSTEIGLMMHFFLANIDIQGQGGVAASPDHNTPGGSYYYHWMRDGALSMRALMELQSFSDYNPKMQDYVRWVLRVQSRSDPNGVDIREEPKFTLPDGEPYTGGWCRPQNDGAALRATTLCLYATALSANGQESYVKQYLWTGSGNGGAIKYDLDFVVSSWESSTCDLWEEVRSNDFFWNRFNQRHALLLGADLATKMGDSSSASKYKSTAQSIQNALDNHWNGNFVFESQNRQKDAAVIVAFNDGYAGDDVFGPTDSKVAGTITTLNTLFSTTFPINSKDSQNGVPGILYGRYEGDGYAGGNPWILTTAALAELYYRGATAALKRPLPDADSLQLWKKAMRVDAAAPIESPQAFAQMLASQGDGVLYRIRYHVVGAGYHLAEQLDKNTGVETSAADLTWSYATVLKAMHARTQFQAAFDSL